MTIQIVRQSRKQLNADRQEILDRALYKMGKQQTPPEEGMRTAIAHTQTGGVVSLWRSIVKEKKGHLSELAGILFSDGERDTLRAIENATNRLGESKTPKKGDEQAVRLMGRKIQKEAWKVRVDTPLFEGEFGSSRFVDTLNAGVPRLKGTEAAQSADTISWLDDLLNHGDEAGWADESDDEELLQEVISEASAV